MTADHTLVQFLEKFITDSRKTIISDILKKRTRYLTVALEDIYQPHNASAVLRSCDCFGLQDVHIIENRNKYEVNSQVERGASKWLNLIKHNNSENNTMEAINSLRKKGYRIIATTPHGYGTPIDEFDVSKGQAAIFFGTEMKGLSKLVFDNADELIRIPMYGFTESFNLSVSAGIILHHLSLRLKESDIEWQLSAEEKLEIRLKWIRNSIKKYELLEKKFYSQNKL